MAPEQQVSGCGLYPDSAYRDTSPVDAERPGPAETNLQRALAAEEKVLQLRAMVEEKDHIIARLESELVKVQVAILGNASSGANTSASAEADVQHLQVMVGAKDRQISELQRQLQEMHESPPHTPSDMGQHDLEVKRLHADLAESLKRAASAEASKLEMRKELTSSTAECMRLQVALGEKDAQMARALEDEKRTSGAHKHVVEKEVARLQTFLAEKDHMIDQLMKAVPTKGMEGCDSTEAAKQVAQLTQSFKHEVAQIRQSFEEEKAALHVSLQQQYEQEYQTLRSQVARLRWEVQATAWERDAKALELVQVMAHYEQRLSVSARLADAAGGAGGFGGARAQVAEVFHPNPRHQERSVSAHRSRREHRPLTIGSPCGVGSPSSGAVRWTNPRSAVPGGTTLLPAPSPGQQAVPLQLVGSPLVSPSSQCTRAVSPIGRGEVAFTPEAASSPLRPLVDTDCAMGPHVGRRSRTSQSVVVPSTHPAREASPPRTRPSATTPAVTAVRYSGSVQMAAASGLSSPLMASPRAIARLSPAASTVAWQQVARLSPQLPAPCGPPHR
mmetsp:Transcript_16896/g.52888  ORF Transcript_16896/g.52888 Transcript_16896/m.52888 type:complete len:559 (+) Transcript_16896:113-1789(+)